MDHRVLIVDDSAFSANLASTALRSAGISVHSVDSPFHVFDAISNFKPHLILLDLNIPGLRGESLGLLLRKKDHCFEFEIMIYSSAPEARVQEAARKVGAVGWVHKSHGPDSLIKNVSDYLVSRAA